ncbi:flagellar filament capping protein FliD [Jeongeupia naejangsanensis]|uniref:Flagellar hook-associated protein 2 n=1 Tax=Jeongeupia naejangsanensis TaxID=613195 RepID=A0ABS2BGI3_9NEIS|nr:flagellar filament capping protein FliD [Jeongeupia naejangsanensis]MBM3114716.1 flagellar filament capping protein FliD [Jeongeupia naejangsanensis]
MADSTINPTQMAQQLATAYTQGKQAQLKTQTTNAQNTSAALTKLQSALSNFRTALTGLSGKTSLTQQAATLSNTGVGTASADSTAQAGSYSFFVEQVASANQVAFQGLTAVSVVPIPGSINLSLADGTSFSVDIATADLDADGKVSPAELARAINSASNSKISATVMTVGGQTQMVLSAGQTGASSQITLDASNVNDPALKAALGAPQQLVAARDAIVWLGDQTTGVKMQQASNTFTAVQGVTMTFTKAMQAGDTPVTLTVTQDKDATAANVQNFVDAYNALEKTLDDLTRSGDAKNGVTAGAFVSDAGVLALRSHLTNALRQNYGGAKLFDLGVSADRNGTLSLDKTKLQTALAAKPDALDKVFGTAQSGLLTDTNKYLNQWLNSATGQIKRRQDSVQTLQKDLTTRQTALDDKFNLLYQRYLAQFSKLQSLQAQMSQTSSALSALDTAA